MEAKKLLRLIKDDITHLEEITGEFNIELPPSSEEVELAIVRAKALLRELELFSKIKFVDSKTNDYEPTPIIIPEKKELFSEEEADFKELHAIEQLHLIELAKAPITTTSAEILHTVQAEPVEIHIDVINTVIEDKEEVIIDIQSPTEEETTKNEIQIIPVISDISELKEEVLTEKPIEVKKTLNETLGESHQLVNDILSPEKTESGYQLIPINSIWDGIGINDRFLFIRELFANSSAKFENTIAILDKLSTIQEAVSYLKDNFKWNKTETSQKFLILVKRRFTK